MTQKTCLLTVTHNRWLAEGLRVLLPELDCRHTGFGVNRLPREVQALAGAGRLVIAVDSHVFLHGSWKALTALFAAAPEAPVVWLAGKNATAGLLPLGHDKGLVLSQALNAATLRRSLFSILLRRRLTPAPAAKGLTRRERMLLPFMMTGVSLPLLAKSLGGSTKTFYHHRSRIMTKTGFRQMCFLQYIYKKQGGLPRLPAVT